MELKDFVSASLTQIIEGVVAAQQAAARHGAFINPQDLNASTTLGATKVSGARFARMPAGGPYDNEVQIIQFDVAVTVIETSDRKGEVGVKSIFAIGGSRESGSSSESASRIKFNVPIIFPHHIVPQKGD